MKALQQILTQLICTFLEALLMPAHRNKTFKSAKVNEAITNWKKTVSSRLWHEKRATDHQMPEKNYLIYTTLQYFFSFLETILYLANYIFWGLKQYSSVFLHYKRNILLPSVSYYTKGQEHSWAHANQYLLGAKWPCNNQIQHMKGLIQVKSHLEIIRNLFSIHKLCQASENMEAWFDDSSRAAQHECNRSMWCSHHCQLGAFPCKWRFHSSADDEKTWISLDEQYDSAGTPWDQHFALGLPAFEPRRQGQREGLSGKLWGELRLRGQHITVFSQRLFISMGRPLILQLMQSWWLWRVIYVSFSTWMCILAMSWLQAGTGVGFV